LQETADELAALPLAKRPLISYKVTVPEHYCRVYVAHVSKLGMLKVKDAKLVVSFYQYADSVVADISKGGVLHEGTDQPSAFAENANLLVLAIDTANELERRNRR
jgi:hypothetical protein